MKRIDNPNKKEWSSILQRPTQTIGDVEDKVNNIFNDVKLNGDVAISKYTKAFDNVVLDSIIVSD